MGPKGGEGPNAVDVKMVPSYQKQPTLPHLLNEYGFEDALKERVKKKRDEERERRRAAKKERKKGESFSEEKDLDKQREMDEHYLKLVRDMYHLRDYYYNEYSRLLSDKIDKQRRENREKDAKVNLEKQKKEEEEKKASHSVKKRLERHTLATTPSTVAVPKTDLYYIIGLEEKLRREGKLKTPSDYQKFHADIQEPHIFYSHFKVRKNSDMTPYSDVSGDGLSSYSRGESSDVMFEMAPKPDPIQQYLIKQQEQQNRSLSRISESRENSRPTSRADNWAITQQFPSQQRAQNRRSITGLTQQPKLSKADQLSDLEKRFPKLEMPKLHCFTLNLAKKPPDPEETKLKAELKAKEKTRKQAGRTYTKMYQLAMSNAAATARIMDTHDDMDFVLHGPDLCDVISDEHWMRAYGLTEMELAGGAEQVEALEEPLNTESESEPMPFQGSTSQSTSRKGSALSSKTGSRKSSRRSSAKSKKSEGRDEEEAVAPPPLPLTMEEITGGCSTKESKTLSSLWTNYLKAGKSPWEMTMKEEETDEDI